MAEAQQIVDDDIASTEPLNSVRRARLQHAQRIVAELDAEMAEFDAELAEADAEANSRREARMAEVVQNIQDEYAHPTADNTIRRARIAYVNGIIRELHAEYKAEVRARRRQSSRHSSRDSKPKSASTVGSSSGTSTSSAASSDSSE
jgi:hypothetical protein